MARVFDRFNATTIGPDLVATDGGLLLTTNADSLSISRAARGNVFHSDGSHGVEFTFYGDDPLVASVGLVQASVSLSVAVGSVVNSVGWRMDTGEILLDGVVSVSGLPIVTKGQVVGLIFREGPGFRYYADYYLEDALVASVRIATVPGFSWAFAVSLAGAVAGELTAALNAGQWPARSDAAYIGWKPATVQPGVVRVADEHWLSAHTDNPADTRYEGLLSAAGIDVIQSVGFWPWQDAAAPRGAAAALNIYDPNGLLDALEVDGEVRVRVSQGVSGGSLAAAADIGRFVLDGIEVTGDDWKRVRLRDAHDDLDEPLNPGVFLPNIPALAWQPQPVVIGAVCSVPLLAANSDGTVGFLSDAPLSSVSEVLDRGDALEVGTWSIAPGDQQLLLESPPVGPVVADVSSIGASMAPATLQQVLHRIYSRVRKSSWSSGDAGDIDASTGYDGIGYYIGGSVISCRQARDAILASYCASAWQDSTGLLRCTRLISPESIGPDLELSRAMLGGDLTWVYDNAPNLSRRMGYRPNAAPMASSDFVTDLVDVPMSRRIELMRPYRGLVFSAVPMHGRYAAAERREPFQSLFYSQADAQAEIDYVCNLYAVERRFYSWRGIGDYDESLSALRPGQVVNVSYDRYGLASGRNMLVVSIQRNPSTKRMSLRLWGA